MEGIVCPNCKRSLAFNRDGYFCHNCQSKFEIKDGIPVFLPGFINKATLEDIRAWDDKESGRTEHLPSWRAILSKESVIQDFIDSMHCVNFDGKVLEIGGGSCWASLVIKSNYPSTEVYATDVSFSALLKAEELATMAGVDIDKYMTIDIQSTPFANDYFDVVFGNAILHHIPDFTKALTEIHRILKPNGIYFGMGEPMATKLLQGMVEVLKVKNRRSDERQKYETQEATYTLSEWRSYFKAAGFGALDISICKNPRYRYHNKVDMLYYLAISLLPDFIVSKLLGSSIHIIAKKGG